jgi:hypothetical protein
MYKVICTKSGEKEKMMETMKITLDQLEKLVPAAPVSQNLSISVLRSKLKGRVLTPEDADYDAVRTGLSREAVRRPALIVRPLDAGDVSRVVTLARETGMELAIRSGGHSLT